MIVRLLAPASKLATARMLDPTPPPPASARCSGSGWSTRTNFTPRSTDSSRANRRSRRRWRASISATERWCSTTCHRAIWKALLRAGAARLQSRRQEGQAADRLRPAVRPRRLPGGRRGVRRRHRRSPTLAAQIDKIRKRFGPQRVVLVGDRGMITQARIDAELRPAGLDWITALRAPAIKALVAGGALQMSLFDERDMAAITSPDFPGERLIVCRNRELAQRGPKSARICWPPPSGSRHASPPRPGGPGTRSARPRSASGRRGAQSPQDGQALRARHQGRQLLLPPQARGDCRRGRAGRPLCGAHQPARGRLDDAQPSAPTKASPRSSGRSAPSRPSTSSCGRSSTGPPGCAPTSSCACSPICRARLRAKLAPMLYDETDTKRPLCAHQYRCQGPALPRRQGQGRREKDRRRLARAELARADRRPPHSPDSR